ncbi:Epsin domain [Populus alba x Populus x berolinensis]|nr:Epsin domain [Populus alba x Populus x berolinensis]
MGSPLLHEFKRQASSFLKEKIKTARLALTDVTPTEDRRTMGVISRAAFEVDDYWIIVDILHKRFIFCLLGFY